MIEERDLNYWKNQINNYDEHMISAMLEGEKREIISEELLNGLRNFVESIMCYIREYNNPHNYAQRYEEIEKSKKYCGSNAKYSFISQFHENLNASIGHESFYGEYAERLFLKYYSSLIKIKNLFKKEYNIVLLTELYKYPIDLDESFVEYYRLIIKSLSTRDFTSDIKGCDSYYIQKKKMIYVDNIVFYEYSLSIATDNNSRFDRFIAFSLFDIPSNYAIKARLLNKSINFFNQDIDYDVIVSYKIAIRPCELEKMSIILGLDLTFTRSMDYWNLMSFINDYRLPLNKIVELDEVRYNEFIAKVFINKKSSLLKLLNSYRGFLSTNSVGSNVLRYLLYKMNNNIIKSQMPKKNDKCLRTLNLNAGVYGFDKKPFSTFPINHKPHIKDLMKVFDIKNHRAELFAKTVTTKSIDNSCIYISKDNFKNENLDKIIEEYNSEFVKKNLFGRKILTFGKYVYLNENEENTKNIIINLLDMTQQENFNDYNIYIEQMIKTKNITFNDKDKEKALRTMFVKSNLFVVYGAAGSGKSYFANYVLQTIGNMNKFCIASTNPAVDNMRRKFGDNTAQYMTITKYLKKCHLLPSIGLLIIDECSTISAKDMNDILTKTRPKLMLLLGDIYQIKPIYFGNWFSILRSFIDNRSYVDLNNQYRCENKILLSFWNEVRCLGKNIKEHLSAYQISHRFDDSIFTKFDNDEVILCLNYDGLYGINNLNKVLQKNNPNKEFKSKQYVFKVGDPIIFDDTYYYKDIFYNNLKGIILSIDEKNNKFIFTVKINRILAPVSFLESNVAFIKLENDGTIVSFEVQKYDEDYYDNDSSGNTHFPFQIAYAISIHKAQGLEYESVKIIISNEVEENISHSIFYTAITRAKKILNIYWTPESEEKIINSFYIENCDNDANILAAKYPELKNYKN